MRQSDGTGTVEITAKAALDQLRVMEERSRRVYLRAGWRSDQFCAPIGLAVCASRRRGTYQSDLFERAIPRGSA